jgi:EAL domain-containing protein (putative c-di-GMP-specific phosphodiesterase class I)
MGVRSVIDDFGTGYSGLRYLGQLPVDGLKIDKSFVQGMSVTDASIIAATIAMAHSLGLTVVAEGIETDKQRQFLSSQGCDRMQGYLFAPPMPAADFEALVFGSAPSVEPPPAAIPVATLEPAARFPASL